MSVDDIVKYICTGQHPVAPDRKPGPCGEDNTKLILAVPQDGKEYVVECPKCTSITRVRRTPADA